MFSNLFSSHSSSLSSYNTALSLFFVSLSHLASSFSSCCASFFPLPSSLSIPPSLIFLYPLLVFSPLPSHLISLSPSFFPFPSYPAPSLHSLLPSLFFIPSASYYFSFFAYPPPFFFNYSFLSFCPAFSLSLSSTSSFFLFLSLSSFSSSSFSASLLYSHSPFPHHSLSHVSSSLFILSYPPLIHPFPKFKNRMKTFSEKIIRDNNKGVNKIWTEFKTEISNRIDECIPPKMAKTVNKLPWINSTIQKLIRKRDKHIQNSGNFEVKRPNTI